jgi:hypothetical protein
VKIPERPKGPGELSLRPRLILWGAWKTAFLRGASRWSAGSKPNGFEKKRRSGKEDPKGFSDP